MNGIEYLKKEHYELGDNPQLLGFDLIDGVYRLREKYGRGSKVKEGIVKVKYTLDIMTRGTPIDDSEKRKTPLTFELNSGQVVEGFNLAVKNMRVGQSSMFLVPPSLGYGKKGKFGMVPPNVWLMYNIELLDASKPANSPTRILDDATAVKEKGNHFFKSNELDAALLSYHYGLGKISSLKTEVQDEKVAVNAILIACHANMSVCYLKMKDWDRAIESCNQVFALEPYHIKSVFRIAQAYLAKGMYKDGIKIVKEALEKHPGEPNLKQILATIKEKETREKKAYAKMLE